MFLDSLSPDLSSDVLVSASLFSSDLFAGGLFLSWFSGSPPRRRGQLAVTPSRSCSLSCLLRAVVRFTMVGLDSVLGGWRPRGRGTLEASPSSSLSSLQLSVMRFIMEGLFLEIVRRCGADWSSPGKSKLRLRVFFQCNGEGFGILETLAIGIWVGFVLFFDLCFRFSLFSSVCPFFSLRPVYPSVVADLTLPAYDDNCVLGVGSLWLTVIALVRVFWLFVAMFRLWSCVCSVVGCLPLDSGSFASDWSHLPWTQFSLSKLKFRRRIGSISTEVPEFESDRLHDEAKYIEKDTALRMALQQLSGDFTHESMLSLKRFFRKRRAPVIPTGSLKLDEALGIGGLPKGRMVEIYGREASGKTTLALHVIKEAQKRGGYCAYLDAENALDPLLAESMGLNLEKLLFSQPDSAEHSLSMVDSLTKSGSIDVIVVDSVAALVPQCELDVSIGGTHRDEQSRIMTKALRKIHYSLCNSRTLIIFLNQVRANVKSVGSFGPADEVTCGGNALKFYAAIRLRMVKRGLLKTEDEVTGLGVCVEVVKNKLAPSMKKAELQIQFGKGFNCVPEVLQLACDYGAVVNEGGNYFIGGEIFRSTQAAEQYLAENEVILEDIVKTVRGHIFNREI